MHTAESFLSTRSDFYKGLLKCETTSVLASIVKTYLVAVLYGIAYRSLHVRNKNHISRNLLLHNAKLKVLLLPIIEVYGWVFRQSYLSLCIDGDACSCRHMRRKSIVGKCTIKAKHPIKYNALHINHIVCQRRSFGINTLTDSH